MRQRIPLGKLLVEAGLLSEQDVLSALQDQKKSGLKLGQYLIRSRLCREEDIVAAISRQLNISRYTPQAYPLDMKAAQRLPKQLAQEYKAVPLRYAGHVLFVAMPDPLDIAALDKLEGVCNCEVEPVICTEQEFNELNSSVYGMFTSLDGVLDSIGDNKQEAEVEPVKQEVALNQQGGNEADMAPVIRLVNSFLVQAIRDRASDVHISPEKESMQIRFRIDGQLREAPSPPKNMAAAIASRIKILGDMDIAVTRVPQDGRFTITMDNREINVRVSSIPTIYGENLVLRLLDMSGQTLTLNQLGMRDADYRRIQSIVHKPYGMILATGPTGSGKSSSLYAILKEIARPEINVITLEDPVEYRLPGIRQVQLNRRAGMTFADGLRSILRQDPDVIMVGEIRDRETASIAVEAALTGHMVLSTLHTNDASGAATRLIDMGIEPFLVSSTLLCAFAQRLVRRVCPHCTQPYEPNPEALKLFGIDPQEGKDGRATFRKGTGCNLCKDTGFRGRTGVFELLPIVPEVQELINKRQSAASIAAKAREVGVLQMLSEDAAEKIRRGITTVEAAVASVMV